MKSRRNLFFGILSALIFLFSGCVGFFGDVPTFDGPGPHSLRTLEISLLSHDNSKIEIVLLNKGSYPILVDIHILNRKIGESVKTSKIQIGTEEIERCSEEDNTCWIEEVPIYEEQKIKTNIYSNIILDKHTVEIKGGEHAQVLCSFLNSEELKNELSLRFQVRVVQGDVHENKWRNAGYYNIEFSSELF